MNNFSNFFSIIQNGYAAKKSFIVVPKARKLKKIILFFIKEGFFLGFEIYQTPLNFFNYRIYLRYDGYKPVISGLIRVSKVSRKITVKKTTLTRIYKSSHVLVLSTHFGYVNGFQALQKGIGGDLICIIY
jgi:small subunit ribosomal protein S8